MRLLHSAAAVGVMLPSETSPWSLLPLMATPSIALPLASHRRCHPRLGTPIALPELILLALPLTMLQAPPLLLRSPLPPATLYLQSSSLPSPSPTLQPPASGVEAVPV